MDGELIKILFAIAGFVGGVVSTFFAITFGRRIDVVETQTQHQKEECQKCQVDAFKTFVQKSDVEKTEMRLFTTEKAVSEIASNFNKTIQEINKSISEVAQELSRLIGKLNGNGNHQ